jgi:hypothetical protein
MNCDLILRSGLLAASRRMGHKRLLPSFETPRKCAAPQDEGAAHAANVFSTSLIQYEVP